MGGFSGASGGSVQAGLGPCGVAAMTGLSAGAAIAKGNWSGLAYMVARVVGGAIGYGASSNHISGRGVDAVARISARDRAYLGKYYD